MDNPFAPAYPDQTDQELIQTALAGSRAALEALIKRHQHYVYNVAYKLVLSPFDAEDITQDVLIKVITKLSQFKGQSDFRTWLYRITFTHFLQMKKTWLEDTITSFTNYGHQLDNVPDGELTAQEKAELTEFIEDGKLACMNGMLLCLDREQRLVYILGEVFGIDHTLGSQLLSISKDNFRQRLARARRDLYQFMQGRCGLINRTNPCRCERKTKGFIEAGWVDEKQLKFNTAYRQTINQVAKDKSADLDNELETTYAALFRHQPFQQKEHSDTLLGKVLTNPTLQTIFNLN